MVNTALLVMMLLSAGPPQNPASLSGYVLETSTSRPIAGATVSIVRVSENSLTTKTEADGSFRIDGIPPGAHLFAVSKPGYVSSADSRIPIGLLNLADGERRTDVVFRLLGTGTLSGRVLDSSGRPAAKATVRVFRFVYQDVQQEPSGVDLVGEHRVNDLGDYQVLDIPAGRYFVLASPSPDATNSLGAALYPGEREISRADPVEVRPEQETRLREMNLPPAMRGSIRLRIVNATGGPLPASLGISATPAGWTTSGNSYGFVSISERPGRTAETRDFQPSLVGAYVFHAALQTGVGNVAGYTRVEYNGSDTDVDFVLEKLEGQIKGRVLLESANGSTRPLAGAEIEFFGASAESAFSKQDGTFTIGGLLKGPFRFSGSFEMPEGYYVTDVSEHERDLLRQSLMVSENTAEVEVRVRADGGDLKGKVTDSRLRPAENAVVALIPQSLLESRSDRHNTYRIEHSDSTGAFELRGIIPGEYLVYAWSSLPEGATMDPWFMERYLGKGLPLKVDPGARLQMDLTILDE